MITGISFLRNSSIYLYSKEVLHMFLHQDLYQGLDVDRMGHPQWYKAQYFQSEHNPQRFVHHIQELSY